MSRRPLVAALVTTLGCTLAACGSSTPKASPAAATAPSGGTFPVTLHTANGDVTIAQEPQHIVSLSPTATEMLFAIGAGSQVKAVDDQSNYPPEAPRTKLSGYQPNAEAVAAENPDLVVLSDSGIVPQLEKLHITALVEMAATTLDDSYAQLAQLGQATGHESDAAKVVDGMKRDIAALKPTTTNGRPLTYYYELDNTYYTATSKTFIGSLFSLANLRNIADAADKKGSGYPQLSAEYIVQQNPDLVFLADTKCCHQSAATVASRPGWNTLTAVTQHHVIPLDDDVASRWGPRVVDLLREIVQAANAARS